MLSGKLDNKIVPIRRGYDLQTTMCHMSHNMSQSSKTSFGYYGLNSYKNFMLPIIFKAIDSGIDDSYNELNEYLSTILTELLEMNPYIECAAIFVIKKNNQKLVYQIDHDYYFDGADFEEVEPTITVSRISNDIYNDAYKSFYDDAFKSFDADNNYDMYGLVIEIEDGKWQAIVE